MQHAFPCMPCGMRWWRLKDVEEREREVLRASKSSVRWTVSYIIMVYNVPHPDIQCIEEAD